eukprot:TRINITY_DN863_c0_g1_i1.p1 TRINITY_DN863_c0_g1~~TRINITY_DN863_c0_g1_i1.p1  ORF type:complete len:201 (+),score=34.90 TRINITY_DN863_c0_g1_i1:127-729(+)
MGESYSKLSQRIVLVGLDNSGKTKLLYRWKLRDSVATHATLGFNVESIAYKRRLFTMWDLGGKQEIRSHWANYLPGTDAIIFVVDAADRRRLPEVKQELWKLVKHPSLEPETLILIMCNKMDKMEALSMTDVSNELQLNGILQGKRWDVVECSTESSEGVRTSLEWLRTNLKKRKLDRVTNTLRHPLRKKKTQELLDAEA